MNLQGSTRQSKNLYLPNLSVSKVILAHTLESELKSMCIIDRRVRLKVGIGTWKLLAFGQIQYLALQASFRLIWSPFQNQARSFTETLSRSILISISLWAKTFRWTKQSEVNMIWHYVPKYRKETISIEPCECRCKTLVLFLSLIHPLSSLSRGNEVRKRSSFERRIMTMVQRYIHLKVSKKDFFRIFFAFLHLQFWPWQG